MKKITRYIVLTAIFLIPVFPLIVANSFFFPFITGKAFYFRILIEVAFTGWVILAFLDAKYRPRLNALTIGVSIFALIALVSDLLGVNPIRSIWSNFERMEGWITIAHLWMFFIATTSLFGTSLSNEDDKTIWHRFLNTSLAVAFIVSIWGLFQIFGWAEIHQGSTRIDASLGNAIYMAVYMLFHVFISAYFFFVEKAKGKSASKPMLWIYGLFAIFAGFMLFETATRGTILGLIGGVMLALFLYSILGKGESKKNRWIAGGIIGLIVLVGIVFWLNRDAKFIQNNEVLNRLASISISESKTQARGFIWPMAITGFTQRPILGWGQENFNYVFNANYNPLMWRHEQWFDRAHNIYLDWLISAGALGLVAYLALYVLSLMAIWKSGMSIKEKCVMTGLVVGYVIHNVFVFDNLASNVLFFTILGFVSAFKSKKEKVNTVLFDKHELGKEIVEYVVLPISILVFILALYFFNIRAMKANTALIAAMQSCNGPTPDVTLFEKALAVDITVANQEIREQSLSCSANIIRNQNSSNQTKQIFYQLARKSIDDQIAFAPNDARGYLLAGMFLNQAGQFADAQKILEDAIKLTPRKQSAIYDLALNYLNTGKIKEAVELLKGAYESDITNTTAQSAYATALVVDGRDTEMKVIFKDNPSAYENPQIAQAYIEIKAYDKAIALYKKLLLTDPKNVQLRTNLAQTQFAAGLKWQAIETMKAIGEEFPEYKDQVEAAIKDVQNK